MQISPPVPNKGRKKEEVKLQDLIQRLFIPDSVGSNTEDCCRTSGKNGKDLLPFSESLRLVKPPNCLVIVVKRGQ